MSNFYPPDVRPYELAQRIPAIIPANAAVRAWTLPDGSTASDLAKWIAAWEWAGYGWNIQAGLATTPITFAGAYDADAPDLFVHVPLGYAFIPTVIEVTFEAVGTESTMEIMALASPEGDSSATGTAATVANKRVGAGTPGTGASHSAGITATGAIDAAGITDPNVSGAFTFWRKQRPLTDTVATTENDRNELNWQWVAGRDGFPPLIIGSPAGTAGSAAAGASLSVYAASQAGTGFIICEGLIFPPALAADLFGASGGVV